MSNVLKFPKKNPVDRIDLEVVKESIPHGNTIKVIFAWVWLILRVPLFLILYWLRLPITLVCNFLSITTLFAFLFCWAAFPIPKMLWGLGVMSFTSFFILWTYDFILVLLSPQPIVRTL